jgi:uncharacterized protein (DUF697 family)
MAAREATNLEKEAQKLNENLRDRFVEWKRDKFDPYVIGIEKAQDKFFEVHAQGKVSQAFRMIAKDFLEAHEKFVDREAKLETAIKDSLKESQKDSLRAHEKNSDELGGLKSDLAQLKNDFAQIESAIYKGDAPSAEKTSVEPLKEKPPTPSDAADSIINKNALIAAAVGVMPIPVLDIVGIAGVQAKMLDELNRKYYPDDPPDKAGFSKNFIQNLLTIVLGSFGPAVLFGGALGSALKFVPIIGALPGGGAVSLIGGSSTFVVGKLVKEQLEKGLTPTQIMDTLKSVKRSKIEELRKAAARVVGS